MSSKNFMSYEDAATVLGAVKDAIDAAVSSAYHHAGTKTVAQLTHDLLIAANEGNVYNITDSGTTTSDFVEGIGKTIDEGSNVGICKVGDVYKFDLLSGFVDTTNFVQKSQTTGLLKNDGTVNTTIEDDVDSLKSGLTNVQGDVKLNTNDLTTPSRTKNVLPITVDRIKSFNTLGTWSDNTYTHNGIVFTINTDSAGNVVSINANGTAEPAASELNLYDIPYGYNNFKGCKLNGCTGGASGTFSLMASYSNNGSAWANETHEYDGDIVVNESYNYVRFSILIRHEASVSNKLFYPMIRLSTETDATFAPYIPSVESRIEAVESNIANNEITVTIENPSDTILYQKCVRINKLVIFSVKVTINTTISSGNYIIGGLPKVATTLGNDVSLVACATNKKDITCTLANRANDGAVFSMENIEVGTTFVFSGIYVTN